MSLNREGQAKSELPAAKLTLEGAHPAAGIFPDCLERIAGHIAMARFMLFRGEGKDSILRWAP
jgi:hypothetical protein